jgi:hypothetical protein
MHRRVLFPAVTSPSCVVAIADLLGTRTLGVGQP